MSSRKSLCQNLSFSKPQTRKHKFHTVGHTQLVEDPEEIIFNRVLGEIQLFGNFTIGKYFDGQSHYCRFTLGDPVLNTWIQTVSFRCSRANALNT